MLLRPTNRVIEAVGRAIFAIRWLLAPMYLALYAALTIYLVKYFLEIGEMVLVAWREPSTNVMLIILELIDMTMVANLVVMTTTGGYSIFVREYAEDLPNRPRWLNKDFSSSQQKIKLIMSLIGVGAVTMLRDLIQAQEVSWDVILKKSMIMGVFVVCGFAYCLYNILMHSPALHEHDDAHGHRPASAAGDAHGPAAAHHGEAH